MTRWSVTASSVVARRINGERRRNREQGEDRRRDPKRQAEVLPLVAGERKRAADEKAADDQRQDRPQIDQPMQLRLIDDGLARLQHPCDVSHRGRHPYWPTGSVRRRAAPIRGSPATLDRPL